MQTAILLLQCPDQPGIVAQLSTWIFQSGGNILRSDQYSTDPENGQFFIRIEFCFDSSNTSLQKLTEQFTPLAKKFKSSWELINKNYKKRFAIFVSKQDHCLHDLLYHQRSGEIFGEITAIVSNHSDSESLAELYEIPFHYLPITPDNKQEQEKTILEIVTKTTDFLVLARYMQILSGEFLQSYAKDIINIHHSFLPSFKGANPYRQAYERGVKIIGATAHYVTESLDEGPIIDQTVERVSHHDDAETMRSKGKHIEKQTLLRAVEAQCNHRIIRYHNKTIVM